MIDIDKLREAMPNIAATLGETMANGALKMCQDFQMTLEEAVPLVSIVYKLEDINLKVTLSLELVPHEQEEDDNEKGTPK
jgi:hypothetical protein